MNGQRVVCAANRLPCGIILLGIRHWDQFMHHQANVLQAQTRIDEQEIIRAEQGFVDQWGNFLTREEARVIAEKNGQIYREVGPKDELYSENLY